MHRINSAGNAGLLLANHEQAVQLHFHPPYSGGSSFRNIYSNITKADMADFV